MNLVHRIWQALPRAPRRALLFRGMALIAPRLTRPEPAPAGPVIVIGYLSAPTGLGSGARRMLSAMRAAGMDAQGADITHQHRQGGWNPPPQLPEGPGTLVVHVNGPMLPWALQILGLKAVRGKRVIGYWAWELPCLPVEWEVGRRFVHAIWTPSQFCADAMRAPEGPPVIVVPHPLPSPAPAPAPIGRAAFGLPSDAFITLCMFDAGSSVARKNPLGAIEAHARAFGGRSDRVLVLKVHGTRGAGPAWRAVADAAAAHGNVVVLDRDLPPADLWALLAASDVLISLHRAEGFAFAVAEAMAIGRPVVATGWSGNMDFMRGPGVHAVPFTLVPARDPQATYDFPAMSWAEPDLDAAAMALRRIADGPGSRLIEPVVFPAPDYAALLNLAAC